jgi:hypothetical protein
MSRLVFEGDLNKNFGEFYPTPYIDKIVVDEVTSENGNPGIGLTTTLSLLFTVPEHDPSFPTREVEFVKEIISRINLNMIFTKDAEGFDKNSFYPTEYVQGRFSTYYEKTGKKYGLNSEHPHDELSMLLYDPSLLPVLMTSPPDTFPGTSGTDDDEEIRKEGRIGMSAEWRVDETGKGVTYDLKNIPTQILIDALTAGNYSSMYDRTGRKILKVTAELPQEKIFVAYRTEAIFYAFARTNFVRDPTINVLAFTSMQTADEMKENGLRTNAALKLLVGDVAYENVLNNGNVANQTEESFFDDNGDIYVETPIQALNKRFYKADATTHQDMYDKFNNLVQQYVSLVPSVPEDAINTDPELMGSIEVIQNILQTNKNQANFLTHMVNARNLIINRSSGTRSGALYADMATIIARANDVATTGTPLTKKLTVNGKILDNRSEKYGTLTLPNPEPVPDEELFKIVWGRTIAQGVNDSGINIASYLDELKSEFGGLSTTGLSSTNREIEIDSATTGIAGAMGTTKIIYESNGSITIEYAIAGGAAPQSINIPNTEYLNLFEDEIYGLKEEMNVTFGYAVFDWQTALMKNSTLATLVDVERFIRTFGMGIVQRYFLPKRFELTKFEPQPFFEDMDGAFVVGSSTGGIPWETKQLTFSKNLTKWYTEYEPEEYVPSAEVGDIVHHQLTGPGGVPLGLPTTYPDKFNISEGRQLTIYAGERNVSLLPDSSLIQSVKDHKFFAVEFQTLDGACLYMNYDHPVIDNYEYQIEVADYTKSALIDVIKHYYYLIQALKNYLVDASMPCSYNNMDGRFNDFFAESMTRAYSTNPAAAPYVFCVTAYIKHVDFIFNTYNNDTLSMILAAREIVQRISPETGTLDQLKSFYEEFVSLYDTYYSTSSVIGRELIELSSFDDYDDTKYGAVYRVERTFNSGLVSKQTISAQNEAARDEFLDIIDYQKSRFEDASAAYAEALGTGYVNNKERIQDMFFARGRLMQDKLDYERVNLQNSAGNCKFVWWWDGWDSSTAFGEAEPRGDDSQGVGQNSNWDKIKPNGVCEKQYGYVWVKGADSSKVLDFYDVNTYGEPTVFANFRKDRTTSGINRCRYVERAYRIRASDFRLDSDHEMQLRDDDGALANKFGGYYGEPIAKPGWKEYYAKDDDASDQDLLNDLITGEYQGEGGYKYYEKRLPGYELIRNYDDYDDWLADAEAGIDKLDYTPFNGQNRDPSWAQAAYAPGSSTPYGAALTDTENWSQIWFDAYDPARQGITGWTPPDYEGGRGASFGGPGGDTEPDEYSEGDYG